MANSRRSSAAFAALFTFAAACSMNSTTSPDWITLFDGSNANAWRGYQKSELPSGWGILNGELTRVQEAGDIITRETFENFELLLEYKVPAGGNSGIFFGVKEDPSLSHVFYTGPEFQLLDNVGHRDGQTPTTSAGSNFALHAPARDVTRPAGQWNEARLIVRHGHVEHWLNGTKLLEYQLGSTDWKQRVAASKFKDMPQYGLTARGHIALQDHGDRVAFRNIRIRNLP